MGHMYPVVQRIAKMVNVNKVNAIFGFDESTNIGKVMFPAIQATPCFPAAFPHIFGTQKLRCLIPCAIDQDPYFRLSRDIANQLGTYKSSLIHSKFFPALQGAQTKMSSSIPNSAIFLSDTPDQIRTKINKHAFSGGGANTELQREHGANLSVDIPFQYLEFILEDDAYLEHIRNEYGSGHMLTGEVKKILIDEMTKFIVKHQSVRATITDEIVKEFMKVEGRTFEI